MQRRTVLSFLGGATATACASSGSPQSSEAVPASSFAVTPADYLGLNVGPELSWNGWRDKLIPLYQQANVRWIRVWYNWASLETSPGVYNLNAVRPALQLAKDPGFKVLFVIWGTPKHAGAGTLESLPRLSALADYCAWLRDSLSDWVDAWEVWNEPNLTKYFTGSPAQYVETLAAAYEVLRGRVPVVAAGTSGAAKSDYWQALLSSGLEQHCDRVNIHPYRNKADEVVQLVDAFKSLVSKPLWITELGYSTDQSSEETKAAFLAKVMPLLTSRVETLFWYRGIQGEGLHPLRYGIVAGNKATGVVTPLPAYQAYVTFARDYLNS
jgi:hypothetical protein